MNEMSRKLVLWFLDFAHRHNGETTDEIAEMATAELGFNVPAKAIPMATKASYILAGWIDAAEGEQEDD